jgi:hypothetical protein
MMFKSPRTSKLRNGSNKPSGKKMTKRISTIALSAILLIAITACGGGGSSSGSSNGPSDPIAQNPPANSQPTSFTPSPQTLASKTSASTLTFNPTGFRAQGGCMRRIANRNAVIQTHTVTFAADGLSDDDLLEAAQHSEDAVKELRQRFPNGQSANIGLWDNKRVVICVQNEATDGGTQAGIAAPLQSADYAGAFLVVAPSVYVSFTGLARNAISQSNPGKTGQTILQRVYAHEMMHVAQFGQSNSNYGGNPFTSVESWFSEGIARHVEFGKVDIPKSTIVSELRASNPMRTNVIGQSIAPNQYRAASAILTYLL